MSREWLRLAVVPAAVAAILSVPSVAGATCSNGAVDWPRCTTPTTTTTSTTSTTTSTTTTTTTTTVPAPTTSTTEVCNSNSDPQCATTVPSSTFPDDEGTEGPLIPPRPVDVPPASNVCPPGQFPASVAAVGDVSQCLPSDPCSAAHPSTYWTFQACEVPIAPEVTVSTPGSVPPGQLPATGPADVGIAAGGGVLVAVGLALVLGARYRRAVTR